MIDINWSTLLLQIFNFVVMAVILTRFFFKPVIRILDERSKKVTSALDEAERREHEATELYNEYQTKLSDTEEQVRILRQQAEEELQATRRRVLGEARQELETLRTKAEQETQEARRKAILQHRRELGLLVTTLSGKLMREAGGDAFREQSMQEFIQQLTDLPAETYKGALETDEGDVAYVQLVSAGALSAQITSQIEAQIERMAGRAVEVQYKVDPALVAGATMSLGDLLIDGSIAGQLQSLSQRYTSDLEKDEG